MKSPKATFKLHIKLDTTRPSLTASAYCCDRVISGFNNYPLPRIYRNLLEDKFRNCEYIKLFELDNKVAFVGRLPKARYA